MVALRAIRGTAEAVPVHPDGFVLLVVLAVALLAAMAGCGGGGGSTTPSSPALELFVEDLPATALTDDKVVLYGGVDCEGACPAPVTAFGGCPVFDPAPPQQALSNVSWTNRSTGATGAAAGVAIVGHCSCLFSACIVSYQARWSATVPLAMGPNDIVLAATSSSGAAGSRNVAVARSPAAPLSPTAEAVDGGIRLSWSAPAGATSYNVYWSNAPDPTPASGQRITGASSPFLHAGLDAAAAYYYVVTAVAAGTEGPPTAVTAATTGWRNGRLADAAMTTQQRAVAVAIDASGRTHVQVSHDEKVPPSALLMHQAYLSDSAGAWSLRVPPTSVAGVSASISVDVEGARVYLAHLGFGNVGVLVYDTPSGQWSARTLASDGACAAVLVLDSSSRLHLAYVDRDLVVRHAVHDGATWTAPQAVGAIAAAGCGPVHTLALATGADDVAHVAYVGTGQQLVHASNGSGTWAASSIQGAVAQQLGLALGGDGRPVLASSDNQGRLQLRRLGSAGDWSTTDIDIAGTPNHPALAIDGTGHVHLAYVANGPLGSELRYATDAGGSWSMLRIDGATADVTGATDVALALDKLGKPQIVYVREGSFWHAARR